jgi:hypothetical protein
MSDLIKILSAAALQPLLVAGSNVSISLVGDTLQISSSSEPVSSNIISKANSTAQSVSSVTTFTNKLTVNTPVLVAGEYQVECSWQIQHSTANRNMQTRVRLDGTTDLIFDITRQADAAGEYVQKSGFWYGNLTALAHTFTVDFANVTAGAEMRIRNVYLIITRLT